MKSLEKQIKDWTDNVTKQIQKEMNKKTIRVKCKYEDNIMGFNYLDIESEKVLKELVARDETSYFVITEGQYPLDIIQDLDDKGFIKTGGQGIRICGGGYYASIMVTRNGKCYDELKEKYENSKQANFINNGQYNDLKGADLSNSNNQIGNVNPIQNIELTDKLVNEILSTITSNIEDYKLKAEEKQDLMDMIEDVKEKQEKKPNLVKRALKGIFIFAKDVGCQVLASFIACKCGF